jgi:hypothetical protein
MIEPDWFTILISPRTSGFSCSRVEHPLPTKEETLLDLTAPVRALSAYLRNHSQGHRFRSASIPSASNLLARGLLLCIRTRLQKRTESATGRTLSLASADVPVQIRSDLRLRFAAFPPARLAKSVTASLSVASAAPRRALDVVEPWKEALDIMLFADQLLSNPRRCFRLDHLVLLLLFLLIRWTGVASALSHRICTPSQYSPDGVLHP